MIIMELITNISAILALWLAIYGIDSWRREYLGRKRTDTAEEALALIYEAADVIELIRHPVTFDSEYGEIERGEGESEAQWQARRNANIVFVRHKKHQELFNKLYAMRYRLMAQFGADKAEPLTEIRTIVNEVLAAARALSRLWPRENFRTEKEWESHRKLIEEYEAKFWGMTTVEDGLENRTKSAVSAMEAIARAEIEGQGTIYSIINKRIRK